MVFSRGSKKLAEAEKAQEVLKQEHDRIRAHIQEAQKNQDITKQEDAATKADIQASLALQESLRDAIQQINDEKAKVHAERTKKKPLGQHLLKSAQLEKDVFILQEEVAKVRVTVAATREECNKVQKEVGEAEKKCTLQQAQQMTLKRDAQALANAQASNTSLSAKVADAKQEHQEVQNCQQAAHESLDAIKKQLEAVKDENKVLDQQVEASSLEIPEVKTERERLGAQFATKKEELEKIMRQIEGSAQQFNDVKTQHAQKKQKVDLQVATSKKDLDALREAYGSEQAAIGTMRKELEVLQNSIQTLEEPVDDLRAKCEGKQREMHEKESEAESVIKERDALKVKEDATSIEILARTNERSAALREIEAFKNKSKPLLAQLTEETKRLQEANESLESVKKRHAFSAQGEKLVHKVKESIRTRQKLNQTITAVDTEELRQAQQKHKEKQAMLASILESNAEMNSKKASIESEVLQRQVGQRDACNDHDKVFQEKAFLLRVLERTKWDHVELLDELERLHAATPKNFAALRREIEEVNDEIAQMDKVKPALEKELKVVQRELEVGEQMYAKAAMDHEVAQDVLSQLRRQHDFAHWQHNETNWDLLEHSKLHNVTAFPLLEKKHKPGSPKGTPTSPKALDGYASAPRNLLGAAHYMLAPVLPVTST
eukprot:gnl/MRDRNA2_/MRDRNA2_80081_c0_seq1.p1 gnl/MRDRNA2_/MRDRNA2_80081_c0~~gnl/MRDRNA2_/MRDRNA2_80081_c0_seq1.p1  ORF type:complete len:663 (+),score=201.08 gnl/MRDRNA2_/MRDRNA2_80081_c0_seq1:127-2115(+)